MRGHIYIWQSLSGKRYVGRTTDTIERRFRRHVSNAFDLNKPDCVFSQAIRKYGAGTFKLVFHVSTHLERLGELERELIAHFNTMVPNGYNMTTGGDGSQGGENHPCWNKKLTEEMIRHDHAIGLSTAQSAKIRGVSQTTIWDRRDKLGLKSRAKAGRKPVPR